MNKGCNKSDNSNNVEKIFSIIVTVMTLLEKLNEIKKKYIYIIRKM